MKFQNIALIGLGAVGCSYAALMHRSGLNLRIIADEARKARYEDKGVSVNGQPIRFSCLLKRAVINSAGLAHESDLEVCFLYDDNLISHPNVQASAL